MFTFSSFIIIPPFFSGYRYNLQMSLPFQFTDENEATAKHFLCRWSGDRKTYVATKPIPGKGALVYMAVSKEPKLGWDNPQDRTM